MAEFSLQVNASGNRLTGPSSADTDGKAITYGIEFYVLKTVWLKRAGLWRNNSRCTGTPTFQLYRVDSATSGSPVSGGAGSLPSGNYGGWGFGRANPIKLVPGTRYKMAVTVPNYWHETRDQFGTTGTYKSGMGNSVIFAPSAANCISQRQMTYVFGNGYPNQDFHDSNWWVDVVVSDVDPTANLLLGAKGVKGKKGNVNLGLALSATSRKRVVKASAIPLHLAAVGYSKFSTSVKSTLNLALDTMAGEIYHHTSEIPGMAVLDLGLISAAKKIIPQRDTVVLELRTPTLREFFSNTAESVKESLLDTHWSARDQRFKQAAERDAESLSATVLGGIFLTAIGDSERGHHNIRHLRSFRVKGHDVFGRNWEGPRGVMGYKPYAELGAQGHASPPAVIDQAHSWAAVLFKMRYGEPVGDDVDNLRKWNVMRALGDPDKSLYGGQFLGFSRTLSAGEYQTQARPSLATAAWAILAARDVRGVFGLDNPVAPHPTGIVLQSVPVPAEGRYRVAVSWTVEHEARYYEAQIERLEQSSGKWVAALPQPVTGPLELALEGARYVARFTIPSPATPTSFRARIRVRNAESGEWGVSYSQSIPADRLALSRFLDEDDTDQDASGGATWTRSSPWRWLSPGS